LSRSVELTAGASPRFRQRPHRRFGAPRRHPHLAYQPAPPRASPRRRSGALCGSDDFAFFSAPGKFTLRDGGFRRPRDGADGFAPVAAPPPRLLPLTTASRRRVARRRRAVWYLRAAGIRHPCRRIATPLKKPPAIGPLIVESHRYANEAGWDHCEHPRPSTSYYRTAGPVTRAPTPREGHEGRRSGAWWDGHRCYDNKVSSGFRETVTTGPGRRTRAEEALRLHPPLGRDSAFWNIGLWAFWRPPPPADAGLVGRPGPAKR